jgi:hypothetical protein
VGAASKEIPVERDGADGIDVQEEPNGAGLNLLASRLQARLSEPVADAENATMSTWAMLGETLTPIGRRQ